jgi:RNA polymerase sigma-70 factor (ECF subfamily)
MDQRLERIYREHAAVLMARLTRTFGVANIDLVEGVVQDAFVRALEDWSAHGDPDAPLAWLTTVARNLARDRLRRGARFAELAPAAQRWLEPDADDGDEPGFQHEIRDDLLRMMFVACHPELSIEARVARALRSLCARWTTGIARAQHARAGAVGKTRGRARAPQGERSISLELPPREEEELARHDSLLAVL